MNLHDLISEELPHKAQVLLAQYELAAHDSFVGSCRHGITGYDYHWSYPAIQVEKA